MADLANGYSVEVSPPTHPSVEMPQSTAASVTVVPFRGDPGQPGPPGASDVDQVMEALEPPVALDLVYLNATI